MLIDRDRDALSHLLAITDWSGRGYAIAATYTDASLALKEAEVIRPFLVITELFDAQSPGLRFVEALIKRLPDALIAILTARDEAACICAAYRYDVFRYLLKPARAGDLQEMLDAADRLAAPHNAADSPGEGTGETEGLGWRLQEHVDAHYADSSLSLRALAEVFHLNYSYASFLFRQQTGQSYTAYLGALRVNHARRLLAETSRPMAEVAKGTGFRNAQVFYYAFKKATGSTPKEYREEHAKR